MRRLLAGASAMVMAVILTVGGSAPASAAPSFKPINVRIWSYICDNEVIDRRDHCGVRRMDSRTLKVPTAAGKFHWEVCYGGEIFVHVELTTKHVAGGKAEVHSSLLFIESDTIIDCMAGDLKKRQDTVVITEGERAVQNFLWGKAEEGSDGALVQVIIND